MQTIRFIFLITLFILMSLYAPEFSNATKINELKEKISERSTNISELEKEIQKYQKQLEEVGKEKKTLSNEVYRIDLDRKKITTDLNLTDGKLKNTSLNIEKLEIEIKDKGNKISNNKVALSESVRLINEIDNISLVEIMLSTENISEFWNNMEDLQRFQIGVKEKTNELQDLKIGLEGNKKETEIRERDLLNYRGEIVDQKKIIEYNKREKNQLLSTTKSRESNYKKILKEKQRLKEAFEREVADLESKLKIEIDPNSIPDTGYGVVNWPLDKIHITQYFGKTSFSTKNPQIYSGKGHTGTDFRASSGTKVKAVSGGVVKGIGNTDEIIKGSKIKVNFNKANIRKSPNGTILGKQNYGKVGNIIGGPIKKSEYTWWKVNFNQGADGWVADVGINNTCYSYGKWILVEHSNGLSTLYAHLSLIKVAKGQTVNSGDVIGYSGNTGYSTGPHLHFSVYATKGVKITKFTKSINCKNKYIPLASYNAYLNPLSYLPKY